MSGQVEQRRQSWRSQGSKSSAAGGASVRGRRVVWTLCLLLLLLATVLLIAYNLRKRFQHTLVASLFTASQTKTNEPEHPFTWPPLRFASETLAPLSAETTDEFQLRSLTDRFDNSENLRKAIAEHIATLQRDDALVLWIRAKGASFAGQAYLLSGDFRLPQSSAELSQPQGAVPFEAIVDAVSEWQGPTVLLLDWGNQLADARSGMWDNQFLPLVVEQLAAAPPQVYCLVSHLPGEMSLDNIPQQQTLFGRACAEALVGPRRVPDAYQPEVQSDRSLLLGDLAEYVVRRVQADSAGLQTPWLLAGGVGWASGERQAWQELTSTPLVRWGAKGRPWGWPDVAPPASEESQPQSDVGKQLDPPVFSPEADWPTAPLWLALDRWQAAEEKLGGWSLASLAPLTARRLATMTLDLENRWLAGRDFRGGGQDSAMLARIAALQQTILSQAREIEQAAAQGPVAEILSPLPAEVSPSDFARWQQQVATLAEYRQLALPLADLANLGDSLAALDKARIPAGLQPLIQGATEQVGQFLQWYRSANNGATPLLWSGATSSLQRRLQSSRQDIDRQLNELLDVARSNPRGQQLLGERLLQFCWLTQPQRRELLQAMWSAAGSPPSEAWPVRAVSLLVQPQAPQLKRSGRTLWTDLLRAGEASSEFGGPLSGQPSASAVVDALTQQAQVLRQAEQLPEASWLAVDGRDLCQKENGWPAVLQLPILPARPQPAPQWRLAWDNATGGQLSGAQLQLSSPSEPARIDLTLTRIGDAADIETIDVQLTGLLARVAGESSSWQRGELRLSGETLLRVANPRADVQRLPLEFKPSGSGTSPAIRVRVQAGDNSPDDFQLACLLPAAVPVALTFEQEVWREGRATWEPCPSRGTLFNLQPFPGRATRFRCLLSNREALPHTATVELYRLPPRRGTTAKGRIAVGQEIPLALEELSLRSLQRIGVSQPLVLAPRQEAAVVDFSSPPAAAATAENAAATPPANADSTADADISWGLLAVVRLESAPTEDRWRTWVQILPRSASEFLTANSRTSGERALKLEVALKDDDRNGIPDLLPNDLTPEKPITIDCELGGGLDLRQATMPQRRLTLSRDLPKAMLTISSSSRLDAEVELQLSVDGATRAMFEFVAVGGRAARREPPDRIQLRSVGIPDGPVYLRDFKPNPTPQERFLDTNGAMFARPVPGNIEMVLAVDSELRSRPGATPEEVNFRLVGNAWEHDFGPFYGDRDLTASIVGPAAETLTVACQLSDWRFTFDASNSGDLRARFVGSVGRSGLQDLASLVLDGRGPQQSGVPQIKEVQVGENSQLQFVARDDVPIAEAKIFMNPVGRPTQAQQLGEDLQGSDFVRVADGWQLRPTLLPVQKLPDGRYDVRVKIVDFVGNPSDLGPWPLTIRPRPTSASGAAGQTPAAVRGTLRGKLFLGSTSNKPVNKVTVALKELPDKSTTSSDGTFRLADVEAGSYTLQATTEWRGIQYKAEKAVVLKKLEDYQKSYDLALER